MEAVKQFIAEFYLGSYWIPLCVAAVCFAVLTFVLCFFPKPEPLALTAWFSMACAVLAGLAYIEYFKDMIAGMDPADAEAALNSAYMWFRAGGIAVVAFNALGMLIGFCKRRHNARHK